MKVAFMAFCTILVILTGACILWTLEGTIARSKQETLEGIQRIEDKAADDRRISEQRAESLRKTHEEELKTALAQIVEISSRTDANVQAELARTTQQVDTVTKQTTQAAKTATEETRKTRAIIQSQPKVQTEPGVERYYGQLKDYEKNWRKTLAEKTAQLKYQTELAEFYKKQAEKKKK